MKSLIMSKYVKHKHRTCVMYTGNLMLNYDFICHRRRRLSFCLFLCVVVSFNWRRLGTRKPTTSSQKIMLIQKNNVVSVSNKNVSEAVINVIENDRKKFAQFTDEFLACHLVVVCE